MANNIFQVKRTSTSGRTPNTTSSSNSQYINAGEFALNMTDQILYTSDGTNLITIGSNTVNHNVTNTISIGNSSVNSSINSTSFSGTSNNSLNLGGVAAASYVNTSGNYTLTGNVVLTANLTANTFYASNVALGPVSPFYPLNISTGAGGTTVYAAYITSSNASAGNIRVQMNNNVNPLLYFINNGYTGVVVANSTVNQMQIGKVFEGAPVISAVDNLQIAYDSNNDGVGVFEIAKGSLGGRIGTDGTSVVRLTNTGNVGLSNTAPVDRLSVNGTSYLQGNVTFTQGIIDSTGTQGTAGQVLTSNGTGNVYWSTVSGGGSVNTASQYTWTNTQTFSNNITFSGLMLANTINATTISATDFNNISDISLKENIITITGGINKIMELNPVSFQWKTNGIKSYGLIAQEVEKIIPEVVIEKEDGVKSVSYLQIISFLISAIKEQQVQIDKINRIINKT